MEGKTTVNKCLKHFSIVVLHPILINSLMYLLSMSENSMLHRSVYLRESKGTNVHVAMSMRCDDAASTFVRPQNNVATS